MDEKQLFVGAPESIVITALYIYGEGWRLTVQIRRQYEQWDDSRSERYERLSTDELVDVLDASTEHVRAALGYSDE